MPLSWDKLSVVHRQFILKPNPYITEEESEGALRNLATGQLLCISGILGYGIYLCDIFPKFTQTERYRMFLGVQALAALGFLSLFYYDLNYLTRKIPENELLNQMNILKARQNMSKLSL